MDEIDQKIAAIIQQDATGSVAEIAERAGISQTPCWKRIKRLEERGILKKRVALLDSEKLGLQLVGYVLIRSAEHSEAWMKKFTAAIARIPEIVECHRMTGDIDYLLKLYAPDMAGYDRIYKKLIKIGSISDVCVSFSMERLKETTELPLNHAGD